MQCPNCDSTNITENGKQNHISNVKEAKLKLAASPLRASLPILMT